MKFTSLLIFSIVISLNCLAKENSDSTEVAVEFFEGHIDRSGKLFFDGMAHTITELEEHLANSDVKNARFAIVLPTPMSAFATMDKAQNLFDRYEVKIDWFKDKEFTQPAFDDW